MLKKYDIIAKNYLAIEKVVKVFNENGLDKFGIGDPHIRLRAVKMTDDWHISLPSPYQNLLNSTKIAIEV